MTKNHLVEKAKKLFDSYESKFNPYGESGKGPGLHSEKGLEEIALRYINNQKRLNEIGPKSL